jgi:hypothetical protein
MADRYTYLPQIGIAIAVVWGIADRVEAAGPALRRASAAAAACVVLALGLAARAEARHWSDSISLFTHGLAANHYQRALAVAPGWEPARAGLARTEPATLSP